MGVVRWYKEKNQAGFMGQVGKYNSEPQTLKCFSQVLHKPRVLSEYPNINPHITDLLRQWLCRWSQCRSKNRLGRAQRCQSLSKPNNARLAWSHGPVHATPRKPQLLTDKCVYRFLEGNFYVICLK